MIRVSIYYPNTPSVAFDFGYYRQQHFPTVLKLLSVHGAERYEIDRCISDGAGGASRWVAVGHLFLRDVEGFQQGMREHGPEILADIPKYTNATPEIVISEVM